MTDIIKAVKKDIEDEHAAIIQYLYHAYASPDEELRGKLESIARDEMRHFKWLSEWLVKSGHKPTLKRSEVISRGDLKSLIEADVKAEEEAIRQYIYHKTLTDDDELLTLFDRIIADEKSHWEEFFKILDELNAIPPGAEPLENQKPEESTSELTESQAAILQQALEHEYTSILQYLYHHFTINSGEELEDFAIDEMKHMGWFAETLAEKGFQPELIHSAMESEAGPEQSVKSDLAREIDAIEKYSSAKDKFEDEEIRDLLDLAINHEKYHAESLKKMIEKYEKLSGKRFTIGSLRKETEK
ncbi:ferritin-like domain-containing protein [Thermosediminibacter litoriperuensis]|uniref:Bacterioferritin n=1 Tax=Thermosediminibacter litoriperuensis TaxID=291989 RepID=A0A5S5AFH8_9FIRM|nr:ferritin-like domain-containing protein [Thermosediminibacter litoriperuensis]TYP48717.1 bacterioferritin [Thermosediminibacter litoriperuensis]